MAKTHFALKIPIVTQLNSSIQTAVQRRWVPWLMALILLGCLASALFPHPPPLKVIGIMLGVELQVALIYALVFRALIAPIAESVVLDGETLRVRRKGKQADIAVSSITGIRSTMYISPQTITLDLAADSAVGRSITFIPLARFPGTGEHPTLTKLRQMLAA